MIGLTFKQLRYFDALARHRHFGRAAEACSISQPALSLQIKELEGMFGAPLVERGAREIRLTPIGERLLDKARHILLAVEELDDLVRASQGPLAGRLRLGVIPTVAPYFLPAIISALSARFPGLDLTLREAVTQSLIEDLQDGRIDMAVVALPISEPSLTEFALFEEDFVLVRTSRDAGKPVPSPKTLQTMRLLLLEEGHCFRDQALSFCQFGRTKAGALMEGSSLSTLVQMVGAGMGVTLIPEMAVDLETRSADVSIARFPAPRPSRRIGMVWRKSNPLSDQLMQIGAIVRAVSRTGAPEDPADDGQMI
ncbi:LysR family transcriptional regulator [Ponticoccus sp. SC2-23]|uniref:hydrogen peroxide-inducible genes activator n=1 Tax=Alexandriicola marinus TaxID=2081710 RepID=UPI000FD9A819|nr:hydrogen peroxide-inducible genes activator [Alexandriicola marinus]MBM1218754.1 LysR family transcriptional regulator [Ponticoccus sp. SC6-9]MBM1224174.1 LysR family transcriptional regulator [Ponticoccus sp. SC6-15]MBM1230047.1 LysR family transcriptional regulator [Ponticoccus sp. SC6-38]MBM1233140.1 LysR family transcriptional regulator [Ponticoccus sp. SC6-45]MBM1236910.1 LysR family transcriptional regulator [Ponticoccus sp. SC6-49]MBM1242151.1 LysR family transcriptional regulator [